MKSKDQQLIEEAYKKIKESHASSDPTEELKQAINALIPLIQSGQLEFGSIDDADSIQSLLVNGAKALKSASSKYHANKTPSEMRSARSKEAARKSKEEKEETDRLIDLGYSPIKQYFGSGLTQQQIQQIRQAYKDKYGNFPIYWP